LFCKNLRPRQEQVDAKRAEGVYTRPQQEQAAPKSGPEAGAEAPDAPDTGRKPERFISSREEAWELHNGTEPILVQNKRIPDPVPLQQEQAAAKSGPGAEAPDAPGANREPDWLAMSRRPQTAQTAQPTQSAPQQLDLNREEDLQQADLEDPQLRARIDRARRRLRREEDEQRADQEDPRLRAHIDQAQMRLRREEGNAERSLRNVDQLRGTYTRIMGEWSQRLREERQLVEERRTAVDRCHLLSKWTGQFARGIPFHGFYKRLPEDIRRNELFQEGQRRLASQGADIAQEVERLSERDDKRRKESAEHRRRLEEVIEKLFRTLENVSAERRRIREVLGWAMPLIEREKTLLDREQSAIARGREPPPRSRPIDLGPPPAGALSALKREKTKFEPTTQ
jgi:hypothetical protein